jgi:hypothetical protein
MLADSTLAYQHIDNEFRFSRQGVAQLAAGINGRQRQRRRIN